jgi:hypothetical protein
LGVLQVNKKSFNQMTRRSFLKKAVVASAAVAPTIIAGSAMGLDGTVAPSNRIVMGVIATGGQAQGLLRNAIQQPDTQIVSLCDVNRPKVEGVKKTVDHYYDNQDCSVHNDFREVVTNDSIDALIIAPPDHWHAIPCIQAAQAGKDIYCEKPLTYSLEEGRAVVNAAERHGIVFQVGSMQRSDSRMKRACELVRNGYLGKISHINVGLPNGGQSETVTDYPEVPAGLDYDRWVGPAEWIPYHPKRLDWNWRWWMGTGGGQLMDWIGHHGDIGHMGMDWDNHGPSTVEGEVWELPKRNNLYNGPTAYRSKLTYENGTTMTIGSMNVLPKVYTDNGDSGTQWFGENGDWIFVSRGGMNASDKQILETEFTSSDFRFRKQRNHMRDFLDCVKTRQQPIAPVEAGHRSASLGHLSKIACMMGQKLEWNPETERFLNNDMANNMLSRPNRGEWSLA